MAGSRSVGNRQAAVSSPPSRSALRRDKSAVSALPSREALRRDKPAAPNPQPPVGSLDRLIHERLRLGIVSALAVNERLTFTELKQLLHTTDGNLSVHARKLEEANYIACTKSFENRMPKTEYSITPAGRK